MVSPRQTLGRSRQWSKLDSSPSLSPIRARRPASPGYVPSSPPPPRPLQPISKSCHIPQSVPASAPPSSYNLQGEKRPDLGHSRCKHPEAWASAPWLEAPLDRTKLGHALPRIGRGHPYSSLKERSSSSPLFIQGLACAWHRAGGQYVHRARASQTAVLGA